MTSELLTCGLLIIIAFIAGFYLGRDRTLKVRERINKIKPKKGIKGALVVDNDEVAIEKQEKKEEKEPIFLKDFIKDDAETITKTTK